MTDIVHELQTLSDGSQALVQNLPGVVELSVVPDGAKITSRASIDVTEAEFRDLATKAMTHDIKIDTISGMTTLVPKNTSTPSQKRKQANA